MKYAITGHTQGIGLGIFNKLSPNAIGFSKSTGYNICNRSDRERIILESANCDVFINNASEDFGQSELLLELWREWKDTRKTIINVGSRIAEPEVILDDAHAHLLDYSMYKRTLKTLHDDLSKINTSVKVKYCWFGYVGTPKILAKYPHFTPNDYITIETASNIILSNLD
jgi:hypothetical protein